MKGIIRSLTLIGIKCILMFKIPNSLKDELGDWVIDESLFNYIRNVLPTGSTILELGSGYGTGRLAEYYTMYSVEHNEYFLNKYDSTYIYAPLCEHKAIQNHEGTNWYSADILRPQVENLKYDLLLVDGPPKHRAGFVKYKDMFDLDAILVFDDYARSIERKVVNSIASHLKRPYIIYGCGEGKPFGVINDPCTR